MKIIKINYNCKNVLLTVINFSWARIISAVFNWQIILNLLKGLFMKIFSVYRKKFILSFLFLSSCLYSSIISAEEMKKELFDGIFNLSNYHLNSEGSYYNGAGIDVGISILFPIDKDNSFSFVAGPRYQAWRSFQGGEGFKTNMLGIEAGIKYTNLSNFLNIYLTGTGLYDVQGDYKTSTFLSIGEETGSKLKNHYDIGIKSRVFFNLTNSFGLGIEGNISRGYLEFDDAYDSLGKKVINGGSAPYSSYSLGINLVIHI